MFTGKFSDPRAKLNKRANFKLRWQEFCRENFHSEAQLAAAFAVSPDTAKTWMAGENAPGGWVVADALEEPELRPFMLKFFGGSANDAV